MVGRRIEALEDRHGARLVERTTRPLRLTEIGQRVLEKAIGVVETVAELSEIARPDAARLTGRIRLTGPTTLGITRLAGIVAELCEAHPALSIELDLGDRNADLVAEGFDLAVRIGALKPSGLIARRVGTYRFTCCASPSLLARPGASKGRSRDRGHR